MAGKRETGAEFKGYGRGEDFMEHEMGKVAPFVEKSGGPIDPYGDTEKKEKNRIDMNAGIAFNKDNYTKVDTMGTDMPKKHPSMVEQHQDGYHFKTEEEDHNIDPFGTYCGKEKSGQTSKRG